MQLSKGQAEALDKLKQWYEADDFNKQPFFYLAGYAGTGKTTIESIFTDTIKGRVVRACYTGKAAIRLQEVSGKPASTIHSLIYKSTGEDKDKSGVYTPNFELDYEESALHGAALLVLDECSMVDHPTGDDILSFKVPVLVLGDPGQLPPIKGAGFFTKRKPDAQLTEIHRQALDNPILRIATDIRNGKILGRDITNEAQVFPLSRDYDYDAELLLADIVLCGTNKIRIATNKRMRELHGHTKTVQVGDRLICLRNNKRHKLFNGMIGTCQGIEGISADQYMIDILFDGASINRRVPVWKACFTNPDSLAKTPYYMKKYANEFDFGYCVTVHKSQGSQWNRVLILDDGFLRWDKPQRIKWLYTAITRAVKELVILHART